MLQQIGEVYHHEKICRQKGFNAQERLVYHQTHSAPVMEAVIWLNNQLLYHLIEPNSGLGQATTYLLLALGSADTVFTTRWRADR